MTPALVERPHERRVQRFAVAALALAVALAVALALHAPGALLGLDVPRAATLGLAGLGAAVGVAGAIRRSSGVALAACALLVLAVVPAGGDPGLAGYALGVAFAAAVLSYGELVHMTQRYEKAHRAVEQEGVPEEHVDRVADEAVKTLAARAGVAALAVLGAALLALGLASSGPRVLRESVETAAPLGVAVVGLFALALASLYVLARGARLRPADEASLSSPEVVADVPE